MSSGRQNIDHIFRDWPYDPQGVSVRRQKGKDGREVLQMRLDMGLLQLETTGRPDGSKPFGKATAWEFLHERVQAEGKEYVLNEEECAEADREFVQFYHRRICWLALREFENAVRDADHTLNLMDICRDHSPDQEWMLSHEQYRPFVLFHRAQAASLSALEAHGPEEAIEKLNEGLERIRSTYQEFEAEEEFDSDELVARLQELRESLRQHFQVGPTLEEQLRDAVAAEKYELAAQIRDEMLKQRPKGGR
jgi:hypothetical protein